MSLPTGFLEKNRDVLSTDILILIHSSKNKFLKEIFNLDLPQTKLGHGTICQAKSKTGGQIFKVGHLPATLTHPKSQSQTDTTPETFYSPAVPSVQRVACAGMKGREGEKYRGKEEKTGVEKEGNREVGKEGKRGTGRTGGREGSEEGKERRKKGWGRMKGK